MNYYVKKQDIVAKMQYFLNMNGFKEVRTPILRRDAGELIKRVQLENDLPYALRDSHELQLRWLLTEFDSVYEIGACFRHETADKATTNINEFLLMELFTSKYNLCQIKELVKELILSLKPSTAFEEISISNQIKKDFKIDLATDSQEKLYECLKNHYIDKSFEHDYEYVLYYIESEIEPLSKDKVVFFTDYPECTCSYADIKQGNIINRFELFANELEIANGFDDECDPVRFMERNKEFPIFSDEEKAIAAALKSGKLPSVSAGVGIGIERLCMFLFSVNDISELLFTSDAF